MTIAELVEQLQKLPPDAAIGQLTVATRVLTRPRWQWHDIASIQSAGGRYAIVFGDPQLEDLV